MKKLLITLFITFSFTSFIYGNNALQWINDISVSKYKSLYEIKKLDFGHGCVRNKINQEYKISNDDFKHILNFPNLEYLNISESSINDNALKNISRLKNLKYLYVSDSKIKDAGLKFISGLDSLEDLSICYIRCTNSGVKYLTHCKRIKKITMNGYLPADGHLNIDNETLEIFSQIKTLKILYIKMAFTITDTGIQKLMNTESLEELDVSNTNITDNSIKYIAQIKTLKKINIASTHITRSGIEKLKMLRKDMIIEY